MSSIQETIAWVHDALSDRPGGMAHYCVQDGEIKATNGSITVGHPWEYDGEFLVPGSEFEKVLKRMPENIVIEVDEKNNCVKLRSGRFRSSIETLKLTHWNYPSVTGREWLPVPDKMLDIIEQLRPFVNEDAEAQPWTGCIALQSGWLCSTNNMIVAGAPCEIGNATALLPAKSADFILSRPEAPVEWSCDNNNMAFRWKSGAWMRSQLVEARFTEKALEFVRAAFEEELTQEITDDFREAFKSVSELADDTVSIFADHIESRFGKAEIDALSECETPASGSSVWSAKQLLLALENAHSWSPSKHPGRTPFRGDVIAGFVVGRKA